MGGKALGLMKQREALESRALFAQNSTEFIDELVGDCLDLLYTTSIAGPIETPFTRKLMLDDPIKKQETKSGRREAKQKVDFNS